MGDTSKIGGIHYEIMRRCYNPSTITYKGYGAKGITVCAEWHDRDVFREWAKNNGYKKGCKLLRKDKSKGYTPDNCYFSDPQKHNSVTDNKESKNRYYRMRAAENKRRKEELGLKRYIDSPLYGLFTSMHTRCHNRNNNNYQNYGGRGITVCDEWCGKDGFYNFLKWSLENGWSYGLTLDRVDNDKGYSPDNCRWTSWEVQRINKRNIKLYTYKGVKMCIAHIERMEKIPRGKLRKLVNNHGLSVEDAVNKIKSKTKI